MPTYNEIKIYPLGGVAFFRNESYQVLIRLPAFKFKPSQDDVGHFDVICKDGALIVDAGTFSYFLEEKIFEYYQGVRSHNTIYRRNDYYNMGKLSRFIFHSWSKGSWEKIDKSSFIFYFKNIHNDRFERTFYFGKNTLKIVDRVSTSKDVQVISGLNFSIYNDLSVGKHSSPLLLSDRVKFKSDSPLNLSKGEVSRCYGESQEILRVEALINEGENSFEVVFRD